MTITDKVTAVVAAFVLTLSFSGCSTLGDTVTAPPETEFRSEVRIARLELPETPGQGAMALSFEESPYTTVHIKDTRATPGQQEISDGERNHHAVLAADIGLSDRFSIGIRAQPSFETLKPGIRIQLAGAPFSKAGAGNTSLSIGISYLYSTRDRSEDVDECVFLFCSGDREFKVLEVEQSLRGADTDLIAGYRFHQRGLLYTGGFYQNLAYRNRVTYTDRDADTEEVVSSTVSTARSAVDVRGVAAGIAVNVTPRWMLIGEYLRYRLHWHRQGLADEEESWGLALRANL